MDCMWAVCNLVFVCVCVWPRACACLRRAGSGRAGAAATRAARCGAVRAWAAGGASVGPGGRARAGGGAAAGAGAGAAVQSQPGSCSRAPAPLRASPHRSAPPRPGGHARLGSARPGAPRTPGGRAPRAGAAAGGAEPGSSGGPPPPAAAPSRRPTSERAGGPPIPRRARGGASAPRPGVRVPRPPGPPGPRRPSSAPSASGAREHAALVDPAGPGLGGLRVGRVGECGTGAADTPGIPPAPPALCWAPRNTRSPALVPALPAAQRRARGEGPQDPSWGHPRSGSPRSRSQLLEPGRPAAWPRRGREGRGLRAAPPRRRATGELWGTFGSLAPAPSPIILQCSPFLERRARSRGATGERPGRGREGGKFAKLLCLRLPGRGEGPAPFLGAQRRAGKRWNPGSGGPRGDAPGRAASPGCGFAAPRAPLRLRRGRRAPAGLPVHVPGTWLLLSEVPFLGRGWTARSAPRAPYEGNPPRGNQAPQLGSA